MRIILGLPFSDAALADGIRRLPGIQVVKDTPYYNQTVLNTIRGITPAPDVAIVGEAMPPDADMTLLQFIGALRQVNIRVVFLGDKSKAGDKFLADLVTMGVTDIVLGGTIHMADLAAMLQTPTPWAKVSFLLNVSREAGGRPVVIQAQAAPPPDVVIQTKEVVVEKVVQVQMPGRKVIGVFGLGPHGAGVSTVALNLATSLASAGVKAALVDGDTRWPCLGHHYNLPYEHDGLASVAKGMIPHQVGAKVSDGLTVFGSQVYPAQPAAQMLGQSECLGVLDQLQSAYDQVVVDVGYQLDHPFARTILRAATNLVLVMDPDMLRVVVAKHDLAKLAEVTTLSKCVLVVNRSDASHKQLTPSDVQEALQPLKLLVDLPLTPMATEALAACRPLVTVLPKDSPYVRGIQQVAGMQDAAPAKRGWWPF